MWKRLSATPTLGGLMFEVLNFIRKHTLIMSGARRGLPGVHKNFDSGQLMSLMNPTVVKG